MKKTPVEIISNIRELLNELERVSVKNTSQKTLDTKREAKKATGCIGAIQDLVDEGFLNSQKTVLQVVNKLIEEGQPYSKELVSMNLLNLVKPPRRILRRIKDDKQWHYILRK